MHRETQIRRKKLHGKAERIVSICMTKPVNQNKKLPLHVIGHYAYLGVNGLLILAAIFMVWSVAKNSYQHAPTPTDPITQKDFDKSLDYLDKKEGSQ